MKNIYLLFILLSGIGFIACTKEYDPDPGAEVEALIKDSYNWYPLALGKQWTYSIDSFYFRKVLGTQVRDTVNGTYRETITDTIPGQGRMTFRILREKKTGDSWQGINVYSVSRDKYQVIRTEDNIALVDLIFPVSKNASWDPYKYTDKNREFLVQGHRILLYNNFNSALIRDSSVSEILGKSVPVIEVFDGESDDQLILRQFSKRIYAKGFGLVSKEQEFFGDQTTLDRNIPWLQKAEVGFMIRQTLVDFK